MLRLFKAFIVFVFTAVESTHGSFKFRPSFFIVFIWNTACIEKLLPKCLNFFDQFLPSAMIMWWAFRDGFNLLDDFLFGRQINLVDLILIFKVLLSLVMNGFGSCTESLPYIFSMFPIHWT